MNRKFDRYTLLMRPTKIEKADQWFKISRAVLAEFSREGNSIYNIIPPFKKKIV